LSLWQQSGECEPAPFWQNRTQQVLLLIYLAFWVAMAVKPEYPEDWWIENILVFATAAAVLVSYRWFRFSELSYGLLALFLILHTYSAHYAYSQIPIQWLNELFGGTDRMNFDRLVHLSYGLLMGYPIWELLCRSARVRGPWSYLLTVTVILATGAFYELLEMWIAIVVAPDLQDAFVGTQGDIWDAQKDMALGMYGAIAAMAVTWLLRRLGLKSRYA
jgi:putative membrane protein